MYEIYSLEFQKGSLHHYHEGKFSRRKLPDMEVIKKSTLSYNVSQSNAQRVEKANSR